MTDPDIADRQQPTARTLGNVQRRLSARFASAGLDSPALDARLLVTGALGLDAAVAVRDPGRPVGAAGLAAIEVFAGRRLAREPVSRILASRAFYGLDLEIGPATLDPRPETETLVETVLEIVRTGQSPGGAVPRILDLGTGSGAIVIALLQALPGARGVATDISPDALAVARRNAERHGVAERLVTKVTCWLDDLAGPFDLIVANPPYIPTDVIAGLAPEVAVHDPHAALDGGADGLDAYRALLPAAAQALAPGGWLALEIGCGQEHDIKRLAESCAAFHPEPRTIWRRDLAGHIRCVAVQTRT